MGVLLALAFRDVFCRDDGVFWSFCFSLILSWSDDYVVLDDGRVNGRSDDALLDANVLNGDDVFSWNPKMNDVVGLPWVLLVSLPCQLRIESIESMIIITSPLFEQQNPT